MAYPDNPEVASSYSFQIYDRNWVPVVTVVSVFAPWFKRPRAKMTKTIIFDSNNLKCLTSRNRVTRVFIRKVSLKVTKICCAKEPILNIKNPKMHVH